MGGETAEFGRNKHQHVFSTMFSTYRYPTDQYPSAASRHSTPPRHVVCTHEEPSAHPPTHAAALLALGASVLPTAYPLTRPPDYPCWTRLPCRLASPSVRPHIRPAARLAIHPPIRPPAYLLAVRSPVRPPVRPSAGPCTHPFAHLSTPPPVARPVTLLVHFVPRLSAPSSARSSVHLVVATGMGPLVGACSVCPHTHCPLTPPPPHSPLRPSPPPPVVSSASRQRTRRVVIPLVRSSLGPSAHRPP